MQLSAHITTSSGGRYVSQSPPRFGCACSVHASPHSASCLCATPTAPAQPQPSLVVHSQSPRIQACMCSSHHIHNNDRQPCLIKRCKCSALPTATCTALQIGTYLCRASDPAQHPDTQDAAANNRHICVSNHVSRATRLLAREVHYAGLAGRCLKPPPVPLGTVASSCAGTCLSAQAQHRAQWTARQQLYTLQLSMNGRRVSQMSQ